MDDVLVALDIVLRALDGVLRADVVLRADAGLRADLAWGDRAIPHCITNIDRVQKPRTLRQEDASIPRSRGVCLRAGSGWRCRGWPDGRSTGWLDGRSTDTYSTTGASGRCAARQGGGAERGRAGRRRQGRVAQETTVSLAAGPWTDAYLSL